MEGKDPMERIRLPAVAGVFYPGEGEELRHQIRDLLGAVRREPEETAPPKALVVPHAGYRYCGPVAASGYASLNAARDRITRVVLLGPSHCVSLEGLALSRAGAFRTPLGDIEVDQLALEVLAALPQVCFMDRAHDREGHESHKFS